jgi:hypothetical protein
MEEKSSKTQEPRRYPDLSKTYNSRLEDKFKDYTDYSKEDLFKNLAEIYNTARGFGKLEHLYRDFTEFMNFVKERNSNPSTRLFSMSESDVKEILNRKNY